MSCFIPDYEASLALLSDNGLKIDTMDARTIWQKLFLSALFELSSEALLYWIIDVLDDSDRAIAIIDFLSHIKTSKTPIHVLITSRSDPITKTPVASICLDDADDIRRHAASEKQYMPGNPKIR